LNEIEWLNQQLKEKSSQVLDIKSNFNQKIYDLESQIDELGAELKKVKSLKESVQTANTSLEEQNEELSKKLSEVIYTINSINKERNYSKIGL
jgi:regulator of replication initiation timing